ncbi:hypothetical protein [Klebsiella pneumoniae]
MTVIRSTLSCLMGALYWSLPWLDETRESRWASGVAADIVNTSTF